MTGTKKKCTFRGKMVQSPPWVSAAFQLPKWWFGPILAPKRLQAWLESVTKVVIWLFLCLHNLHIISPLNAESDTNKNKKPGEK